MPPGLTHAIQCGDVRHETGAESQGDPRASLCELVAGPPDQVMLTIACGRIQATYAGATGVFDHLKEAIVLDFDGSPQMRSVFEALIDVSAFRPRVCRDDDRAHESVPYSGVATSKRAG